MLTLLTAALMAAGIDLPPYQVNNDGITVYPQTDGQSQPGAVRLQVIDDDIIRVTAAPGREIPSKNSLITVYEATASEGWAVADGTGAVTLSTPNISAGVSLITGEVVFGDPEGNIILQETWGGGKFFSPTVVEGKGSYSIRQVFESPADEGLYGLGQHQSDEYNYKGRNETLFQYNTKVSVPFFVSTRNYGILWDNNSLTRWGDPREYAQLDQFKLYDENGNPGGLTATYMVGADPGNIYAKRLETTIDYENLETVGHFPEGFPFFRSRITWEGWLEAPESGTYHFSLYYAGYTTVYVDGEETVAERWRTAWNPNTYKFTLDFEKGEKRHVKLDWRPDGGVSYMGLKALSPRPTEEQGRISLWSEMGDLIDYYFIKGNDIDGVIAGYRRVTGRSQIMPKWAMGYWQSRERYKTQDELIETVEEYRKRKIPLDNIVQDWSYWPEDAWGSHDFDPARFPDPKGMIDRVHSLDARIMISVWPKFYHTTEHYKQFERNGWMYDRAVKDSIRDWIGEGYIAGFYDAYSAGARKLFWQQMNDKLYSLGMDAWWMDASEPDILSNAAIGYRKRLMTPTALGPGTEFFNAYSLVNAEAIYDGQRSVNPNERVFLLTRSGFAGLQRYSTATWSGDIGTRWEDMKAQISAGINFAMSGIPYWTMDIGGFCVENRYERAAEGSADMDEWRELNTRWFQFGAFCPLFRSHGQYPYREIYNISPQGHPAYNSMVYYTELRYRLMPYIYSLASKTWFEDYTIMRGLVMDFASDPQTHNIGDQYMLGPALMAAPVYEYGARNRQVYFPRGAGWYDYEDGRYINGGRYLDIDAPYERMPLFVREGSVIPTGKVIQSTAERQDDLEIKVYAGADGSFKLYEDEGTNYNYEKGDYSEIIFTYDDAARTVDISVRNGSFRGMPESRVFTFILTTPGGRAKPVKVRYEGAALRVKL